MPQGYMPVAVAGGWYLELCPDGIPVATVAALFGDLSQHHHSASDHEGMPSHADMHEETLSHGHEHSNHKQESATVHADHSQHAAEEGHHAEGHVLDQCDLGSLFGSSILLPAEESNLPLSQNPIEFLIDAVPMFTLEQLRRYNSRAPPILTS